MPMMTAVTKNIAYVVVNAYIVIAQAEMVVMIRLSVFGE